MNSMSGGTQLHHNCRQADEKNMMDDGLSILLWRQESLQRKHLILSAWEVVERQVLMPVLL